jgi:hypothetical protein
MRRSITRLVNRNGIEGYMDSSIAGFIIRGVINCDSDIVIRLNSINDVVGGFESLDIVGVYDLQRNI